MRREDLPTHLLAAAALIVAVFTVSSTRADADLWGHVRFGQDILETSSIPRHDPYSFTSDIGWVNHEWLAEVLMGGAYNLGAGGGLTGLKLIVATGTLVIVWTTLAAAGVLRPLAVLLLLVVTFGTAHLTMTLRPQVFSMLYFAALLGLLNKASRGRPRLLLWLPVLFALWANTHGGWLVGAGVLLSWSTGILATRTLPWQGLIAAVGLAIAGTLANPYGVGLWRFLWETVGLSRADIVEWQPLHRAPVFLLIWLAPAALTLVTWRRCGRAAAAAVLPVASLGILALRVARLEGFFTLASVMLLGPCLAGLGPRRLPLSRRPTGAETAVVGALCVAGFVATAFAVTPQLGCVIIDAPGFPGVRAPEVESVTFLRNNQLRGRLLTWFDYGQIAIWHLSPAVKVSYDGRRETVYSRAVQGAHNRFYSSSDDAAYARTLGADYVWLPRRLPVVEALEKDGWVRVFLGPESVVLAKEAGKYVTPAPWTGQRCFPGP